MISRKLVPTQEFPGGGYIEVTFKKIGILLPNFKIKLLILDYKVRSLFPWNKINIQINDLGWVWVGKNYSICII